MIRRLAEARRRTSHWIMREAMAQYDFNAAQRAVKASRSGVKILAYQSRIGRPVEDMKPEFREWQINFGNSGYVAIIYFIKNSVFYVINRFSVH